MSALNSEFAYATAAAFRTALKVKFTEIVKHDPRIWRGGAAATVRLRPDPEPLFLRR
jgi:hypothetical protein